MRKISLLLLIIFYLIGCCKKPLAQRLHKQGYYNCINNGGEKPYCSRIHNYRIKKQN